MQNAGIAKVKQLSVLESGGIRIDVHLIKR